MFFEAHVFGAGNNLNSFTTNAFLDQEGYVEPKLEQGGKDILSLLPIIIPILILTAVCLYFCCKKNQVKIDEQDKADYKAKLHPQR